jgi:hypothetical protein
MAVLCSCQGIDLIMHMHLYCAYVCISYSTRNEDLDTDLRAWNRIILGSRVWIRIKGNSRIPFCIKVKRHEAALP